MTREDFEIAIDKVEHILTLGYDKHNRYICNAMDDIFAPGSRMSAVRKDFQVIFQPYRSDAIVYSVSTGVGSVLFGYASTREDSEERCLALRLFEQSAIEYKLYEKY